MKLQKGFAQLFLVIFIFVICIIGLSFYSLQKGLIKRTESDNQVSTKKLVTETTTVTGTEEVTLFLPDYASPGTIENPPVIPVSRQIFKTSIITDRCLLTMEKLFEGPIKEKPSERGLGNVYCDYCKGSKTLWAKDLANHELNPLEINDIPQAKSCTIEKGLAQIDLNITYLYLQGTSNFDVSIKTKAIEETIKAIPGVNDVMLTIEGYQYPCTNSNPTCREIIYELAKRNVLVETAKYGEGITHLVRRVLRTHILQQKFVGNEIVLTADQTLYTEDYIQNRTGNYPLDLGQKIEFPLTLIEEAIEKARAK